MLGFINLVIIVLPNLVLSSAWTFLKSKLSRSNKLQYVLQFGETNQSEWSNKLEIHESL